MGWIVHDAIIVTSWDRDLLEAAHAVARGLMDHVSEIVPGVVNYDHSFAVLPDGSKEGWEDSDTANERRAELLRWIDARAYSDGSNALTYAACRFGEIEPQIASNAFGDLPLLTEFKDAACHGERADLLLTMPLSVILRCSGQLQATCAATGLAAGERYCALVTAALTARRTPGGELPGDLPDQIATDGAELQHIADQWRPVTEADGHCRAIDECTCPDTRTAREACPSWRFAP